MIINRVWKLTEQKAWRRFSLALSLVVFLSGTWALCLGVQGLRRPDAARPAKSKFYARADAPSYAMSIPVRYLPNFKLQEDPDGTSKLLNTYGRTAIEVPSHEVALVMVDLWNQGDPPLGTGPTGMNKKIKNFLEKCRGHGVTIIHAPNHPVADRYTQYYYLKAEVDTFLGREDPHGQLAGRVEDDPKEILYRWPPPDLFTKYNDMRGQGKANIYEVHPKAERDISRFFTPRRGEFVLVTSDQFRYVLWLRKIKVLIYVGGATNACMLQRPTGITRLAGMDDERSTYTIVVMEDCSVAMQSPWSNDDTVDRVIFDYLMTQMAFVGNSAEVEWER